MKILLVRESGFKTSYETNITGIYPPLGLAYLASVLRNADYPINILDNQIARLSFNSLKNEIEKFGPDVVLLSSMTPSWPETVTLSRLIKDISPQIIIGVGGAHISAYPIESLFSKSIDFGIYGEGEKTILEVLRRIQENKDLDGVKGTIFRKNGKVVVNAPREEIDNLDSIPFPAIDLLPYKKYVALSVGNPFFTTVTSRGCPFSCNFCFQGYLGRYRTRSPGNIVEEIESLVNKYRVREIIVFDEAFGVEEERALEICGLIRKKGIKFKWDVRMRVDLLNKNILESLKNSGCSRIHLGIESGNQEILYKMRKGINIREIIEKVNMAKKFGFELRGYFMLAYPGETCKSIYETIEFAKSLPLDWASFTVTMGLPGTEIYKAALKNGDFHIDYWKEYTKGNILDSKPYFVPEGLDEDDLFRLKKKAYLEFYLRPRIIWNILKNSELIDMVKNFRIFLKLSPSIFNSIAEV